MKVLPVSEQEFASLKFDVLGVQDRGPNDSQAVIREYLLIWLKCFVHSIMEGIFDLCTLLPLGAVIFPDSLEPLIASSSAIFAFCMTRVLGFCTKLFD